MDQDADVMAVARRIADELEAAGLPYAIGGALAYAYWGPPRGTHDVDLNIFVGPDGASAGLDALTRAGVTFDRAAATTRIAEGAHVRGRAGDVPVDVFFNSIPLHEAASLRAVERPFLGRPARILTAEDLTVLKLLFHRSKDLLDVERLVGLQREALDRAYVRGWLVDCVGEDDHRIVEWDALLRQLGVA